MACFSLEWLRIELIYFLVICFVVAVLKLVIPKILSWFGPPPGTDVVVTILWWLVGLLVGIWLINIVFSCLFGIGSGGLLFPLRGVR